jgi:hypothetical protein
MLLKIAVSVAGEVLAAHAALISDIRFGYSAVARIAAFSCVAAAPDGRAPMRTRTSARAVLSAVRLTELDVVNDANTILLFLSTARTRDSLPMKLTGTSIGVFTPCKSNGDTTFATIADAEEGTEGSIVTVA